MLRRAPLIAAIFAALATAASAAPFAPGDFAAYRISDQSGNASPAFIDEYTPTGTLVQTVALPTTPSGANRRLTGSADFGDISSLSRSTDGSYLLLGGYDAAVGAASPLNDAGTTTPRVLGRIGGDGVPDTTTSTTRDGGATSVASIDGTGFWTGFVNSGGIAYHPYGSTGAAGVAITSGGEAGPIVAGGQLYAMAFFGAPVAGTVGSGTPMTGPQPFTGLPGVGGPSAINAGLEILDLTAEPGVDTLYASSQGTLSKYCKMSGTWVAEGTISGFGNDIGIVGVPTPALVSLVGDPQSGGLRRLDDTAGCASTVSPTVTPIVNAQGGQIIGVSGTPAVSTGVGFHDARAVARRGVLLRWRFGGDRSIVGFDVLRTRHGAKRVRITRRLVKGPALDGTGSYRFVDRAGQRGDRYFVRSHSVYGLTRTYGPFRARVR